MFKMSSFDSTLSGRSKQDKYVAVLTVVLLLLGFGAVSQTQAAVTVQGAFSGHTVADVKGYTLNSSPISMAMTTQTPFATNTANQIQLVRGGGSSFSFFTANGDGNHDCTGGCPVGDPRLDGLTFSVVDSSTNTISMSEATIYTYDSQITVTFSGNSQVTIPAGSTISFLFAPQRVTARPASTDLIKTLNFDTSTVLDQTSTYVWFKQLLFDGNGGSASNLMFEGKDFVRSTDVNPTSVLPSTLYRAGYTLTGWNTAANGTGTAYALGATFSYTTLTATLYAQWAVAPKYVTFNSNSGVGSIAQQSSTTAANLTLNTTMSKSGFVFNGWNTLANGTGTAYADGASYPFSASATLYAQWVVPTKTVTFDANGGTGSLAAQTSYVTVNLTTNTNAITKSGYTFNGWNTAANGTGTAYANSASFAFTANTTLYAQWTASSNVVTYNSHGGSAVANGTFANGGTIATLPAAPVRSGYTFVGWFAATTGGSELANGYAPGVTTAITLHARWVGARNTVNYDSHGGSAVSDGSFLTGETITTVGAAPTRAGYIFDGWFTAAKGGTAVTDGFDPGVAAAITLHAHWTGVKNLVSFDSHGGSAVSESSFLTGEPIEALALSPSRAGYSFAGWFAAETGGTALSAGYAPDAGKDITLHAQWIPNLNVISFDSHGGSEVANGSFATAGPISALPKAPTRNAYLFAGWFLAETGGTAIKDGYVPTATESITLHAHWIPSGFKVAFMSNGGAGIMSSQSSVSPSKLLLNKFTKSGYYFDHWNTKENDTGVNYANFDNFEFSSNITLFAQWREIPKQVTAKAVINVPVGSSIDNAPVELTADGLLDQSQYTVTVHSSPQVIDRGTIWSGRLNTVVKIPAGLEAGWHRLVIEGTAADGTPWIETNNFEVSATGVLLAKDAEAPAPSPESNSTPMLAALMALLTALVVGTTVIVRRRVKTK
jgi:uncharacterized repeat protein (TIGR02543 family)